MEMLKKQKKIGIWFGLFLAFMLACTLISRAVYAAKLPQVSVSKPNRTAISHRVEAEGIIRQGREYAVNALAGLRVRTVYAHVGDRATAETLLFDIDMEDLEKQVKEKELAIKKLKLQIAEQERNAAIRQEKEAIEKSRAQEDYAKAEQEAKNTIEKAEREIQIAQRNLNEFKKRPPDVTDNDVINAWEREKRALEDAVNAAVWAKEDAEEAQKNRLAEAARGIADAEAATVLSDSSLEINRLELSAMRTELAVYKEVLEAQGQIYPEGDGIITGIRVSPGERVPDGAAVVYADLTSPLQFAVSLTKEQKKYVNQGDVAALSLGGRKAEEYTVEYIAENEANPDNYEVRILLEEGVGTIGQSGMFTVDARSETYPYCIPIEALHEDANRRKFVYIVSERAGILGKELAAETVYVKVLDQNDSYAAIEGGVVDGETELIIDATEPIKDRAVIRYRE